MLDIQRMRVFRAVVAAGSVSGAATSLGYTPSAVSQHLKTLQRETGLVLVERRGRGIEPTAAGRVFAEELVPVFDRLALVETAVGDLRAGRTGALTISYFASAGAAWIPPVVAALAREFPDLRLNLRLVELAGETPLRPDLEIFIDGAATSPADGYRVTELLVEPYVAVLPADHERATQREVPLAELRNELWVDNDFSRGPCRQVVLDACAAAGFSPAFHVEAHDYPSAIAFVAAGLGITVLPRLGATALPAGVRAVRVVDPVPRRRVMLRTRNAVRDHPALRRAEALLRKRAHAADVEDRPD
jgi:DNA-binding transcriptional LysR family regulator